MATSVYSSQTTLVRPTSAETYHHPQEFPGSTQNLSQPIDYSAAPIIAAIQTELRKFQIKWRVLLFPKTLCNWKEVAFILQNEFTKIIDLENICVLWKIYFRKLFKVEGFNNNKIVVNHLKY